ncbi:hypothetical protein UA44_22640 [Klebsiella aerogenes]|nr:hypothetical protein UA44_22640 [Klebsiella aerogenes]
MLNGMLELGEIMLCFVEIRLHLGVAGTEQLAVETRAQRSVAGQRRHLKRQFSQLIFQRL